MPLDFPLLKTELSKHACSIDFGIANGKFVPRNAAAVDFFNAVGYSPATHHNPLMVEVILRGIRDSAEECGRHLMETTKGRTYFISPDHGATARQRLVQTPGGKRWPGGVG
jgi:hypothetical protein